MCTPSRWQKQCTCPPSLNPFLQQSKQVPPRPALKCVVCLVVHTRAGRHRRAVVAHLAQVADGDEALQVLILHQQPSAGGTCDGYVHWDILLLHLLDASPEHLSL